MRKEDRKLAFITGAVIAVMAVTFQVMLNNAFKPQDRKAEVELTAPFAVTVPTGSGEGNALGILYDTANPEGQVIANLDTQHRSDDSIGQWLQRALPEVMDTDAETYQENLKHIATGMNPSALKEYETFMQDSHIFDTLKTNNMTVRSFVEAKPLMLNKGSVGGRYRWLFDAPVTLTFLPKNATYKKSDPINKHVIIQIQVGRVAPGSGVDELMIEAFRVRSDPAYKDQ